MASSSIKRDQGCHVTENKRLKTASFDANSGWGTVSLFIVEEVMLYLDLPDILESACVCSHWYSVVQDKTFWKKLLKLHRKLDEDDLQIEPDVFYKRLYKMEHAKPITITCSSAIHQFHDYGSISEIKFSNSGEYFCTISSRLVGLWKKTNRSFEFFKKIAPFDGLDIIQTSFNDSDDCILILYEEENCMHNIMVYSIPDCCQLKKTVQLGEASPEADFVYKDIESVCLFGRYTFLVQYVPKLETDGIAFTLYSINEGFAPLRIHNTTSQYTYDYGIKPFMDTRHPKMAVFNDNSKGEKKIVFHTHLKSDTLPKLHILTATSDFSGELVGPNTSTCLTERKFSSPDPKHYSCSHSLTKSVHFQIRQFNDRFPDKIAMVCIRPCLRKQYDRLYPDMDYLVLYDDYLDIRLCDFELNVLHIFPIEGELNISSETKFSFDQHCILKYDSGAATNGTITYFDIKHKFQLDIVTGHSAMMAAAFSPKDPNILCSVGMDITLPSHLSLQYRAKNGLVKFFDFSG